VHIVPHCGTLQAVLNAVLLFAVRRWENKERGDEILRDSDRQKPLWGFFRSRDAPTARIEACTTVLGSQTRHLSRTPGSFFEGWDGTK